MADKNDIDRLIEVLTTEKILISRVKASKILNVDHNRFNIYFVSTGMIIPIRIGKQIRYDIRDVLEIPKKLKIVQSSVRKVNPKDRIAILMERAYEET